MRIPRNHNPLLGLANRLLPHVGGIGDQRGQRDRAHAIARDRP